MSTHTIGNIIQLTTFGESHGSHIGGVLTGVPAGLKIDFDAIAAEMARRRPGQSDITTPRNEKDAVQWLSGIFEGETTGTPIGFTIVNADVKSSDYNNLKEVYRPSHADKTYSDKYGVRDHRGGGRASARETAVRVAAGALVRQLMPSISFHSYVSQVGDITVPLSYKELDLSQTESNKIRCPHPETAQKMEAYIESLRDAGDTIGGVITTVIKGVPAGWGAPIYQKLHAALGSAMLSINAVKGFDYGLGFEGLHLTGSQQNDTANDQGGLASNNSGGIQGGISNGEDIYFRVAFKPIATLGVEQKTTNSEGEVVFLKAKGRHDPCVLPRAVAIVENVSALILGDFSLLARLDKFK
ncbi:MAG: chorismate synthase [Schleiferiaceae bacterium]